MYFPSKFKFSHLWYNNLISFDSTMISFDSTMIILTFITMLILFIMFKSLSNKCINRFLLEYQMIEIIWTLTPVFILIFMVIPSIKILHYTNEIFNNNLSVKAMDQWYWSYEYSDFLIIDFDMFMILTNQLMLNKFRLLDVDNRCILPFNYPIRILTTSMDVYNSCLNSLIISKIKMDSTSGCLN